MNSDNLTSPIEFLNQNLAHRKGSLAKVGKERVKSETNGDRHYFKARRSLEPLKKQMSRRSIAGETIPGETIAETVEEITKDNKRVKILAESITDQAEASEFRSDSINSSGANSNCNSEVVNDKSFDTVAKSTEAMLGAPKELSKVNRKNRCRCLGIIMKLMALIILLIFFIVIFAEFVLPPIEEI